MVPTPNPLAPMLAVAAEAAVIMAVIQAAPASRCPVAVFLPPTAITPAVAAAAVQPDTNVPTKPVRVMIRAAHISPQTVIALVRPAMALVAMVSVSLRNPALLAPPTAALVRPPRPIL